MYNHSGVFQTPQMEESMAQSRFINQSRMNDNYDMYPYGKESLRIANYVSSQMNHNIDEENKRILEKFRIDAIRHRNQRVMKHAGRIPYITESMVPGMDVNPSMFIDRPPPTKPVFLPAPTTPLYTIVQTKKNEEF